MDLSTTMFGGGLNSSVITDLDINYPILARTGAVLYRAILINTSTSEVFQITQASRFIQFDEISPTLTNGVYAGFGYWNNGDDWSCDGTQTDFTISLP